MCEMTLRDKDGEEVRDENGYVTLMDDGFSWGAAALTGSTRALMTTPGVRRSTGRTASGSARRGRYRPRRTRHNDPAPRVCYDPLDRATTIMHNGAPAPASRRIPVGALHRASLKRSQVERPVDLDGRQARWN